MNLQRIYNQVAEFHKAFNIPQGNVNKQLRHDMLLSEIEEFEAEIKDGEITVNAYKELCDIMYVAMGTVYLMRDNQFNILKSMYSINEAFRTISSTNTYIDFNSVSLNVRLMKIRQSHTAVAMITIHTCNELLISPNAFNDLFDEVHASNMSKLDDNGKPIINDGIINPNEPIGKVLKSSNYRKANILPILQKHGLYE